MLIILDKVSYEGAVKINQAWHIAPHIRDFSHEFVSGKAYHLASKNEDNSIAICWLICGMLKQQQGRVLCDGALVSSDQLRCRSWLVRSDEIKRFGMFSQSVKSQIKYGIQQGASEFTEQDIIRRFKLTPERTNRHLHKLSSEAYSASSAIGLANGRKIFCFPPLRKDFVEEYGDLWFKDIIRFLVHENALVLIPMPPTVNSHGICDEVVSI